MSVTDKQSTDNQSLVKVPVKKEEPVEEDDEDNDIMSHLNYRKL